MHFRAKSWPVLFCFTRKTSEKAPLQRGERLHFSGCFWAWERLAERGNSTQGNVLELHVGADSKAGAVLEQPQTRGVQGKVMQCE